MRYRLMATYRGAPYEAGVGSASDSVVLFAACPPPEDLGFEPATGHWRKELRFQDVQAVWQSRPVGVFRGDRCIVLDDLGDRLHIGYLGHDAYRAEELGYWQVDRGVFELVAARDEVIDIVEERTDYPRPSGGPASGAFAAPLPAGASFTRTAPQPIRAGSRPDPQRGSEFSPGRRPQPGPGPGLDSRLGPELDTGPGVGPAPGYRAGVGRPEAGHRIPTGNRVSLPPAPLIGPPLPLEAEALRAASVSSSSRRDAPAAPENMAAPGNPAAAGSMLPGSAVPGSGTVPPGNFASLPAGTRPAVDPAAPYPAPQAPVAPAPAPRAPATRRRRSAQPRTATERIFSDLASLAAIPADSYSVGEEVDGAMCLLETTSGFEVYSSAGGARQEVRVFSDEESACFYLFGVLAAEAVRTGALAPVPGRGSVPGLGPAAEFARPALPRR
ncbi:MAG: hypothetical protein ACRDNZ_17150 [Streptosporangiaceae bacterium]